MTTTRTRSAPAEAPSFTALELDYLPADRIASQPACWWDRVLGVVGFDKPPALDHPRAPVTASMTPALGPVASLCEVWRVAGAKAGLSNGRVAPRAVHYRFCDEFLFGSIVIDERTAASGGPASDSAALQQATETAYREIFAVLNETDHRNLIRIWNYVPEINGEADGDERYRRFNSARQQAFRDSGRSVVGSVPAASALGSPPGSPLSIYFLAARRPPRMIENPRQVSAYHYPPRYGRHSPVFSRACVLGDSAGTTLFVSGTASIVGHETIHRGDVAAQTRETVTNIAALLAEANRVVGADRYSLRNLKLKVYVRRPEDLDVIAESLDGVAKPVSPALYLRADVCREDLLVEIEATGGSAAESHGGHVM